MPVLDSEQLDFQLKHIELPTADEEIWRYSRIDELDLANFHLARHDLEISGPHEYVDTEAGDSIDLFDGDAPDVFAEINRVDPVQTHIVVPAGVSVQVPIVISHSTSVGGGINRPRLIIDAGPDSEVTVIERFESVGDGPAVVLPVLQVRAAQSARVNYLAINELNEQTWSIGHQQAEGDRDSSVLLASVSLGGYYSRVRTEARIVGQGGSTRQVALYFAGGDQMHDFRTIQDHAAPHSTSDLLFKGAVQDHARSVYTGLIKIRENAKGTVAYQTNRNLTLSDGAWAESVPNLDIETNDVKCSHASTVGPIDEDQRFYLESRGVRPEVAERLVVLGFFDEVIAQLPAAGLADELRVRVAAKLDIGAAS